MRELKNCPFCGNNAKLVSATEGDDDNGYYPVWSVKCQGCQVETATSDFAPSAWNHRTPQSEWISVEVALPETDQLIIMCNEHIDIFSGKGSVLITTNLSAEPYTGRRSKYTHWMPLPLPPKEGIKQ